MVPPPLLAPPPQPTPLPPPRGRLQSDDDPADPVYRGKVLNEVIGGKRGGGPQKVWRHRIKFEVEGGARGLLVHLGLGGSVGCMPVGRHDWVRGRGWWVGLSPTWSRHSGATPQQQQPPAATRPATAGLSK